MTKRNTEIELNFLIAGHTKFMCDQMFGIFKKKFRQTMVSCLDDIAKVLYKITTIITLLLYLQDNIVNIVIGDRGYRIMLTIVPFVFCNRLSGSPAMARRTRRS